MSQWVYRFGDGKAEGRADMKTLLGGKGANLAEMSNLGLPVPPGFTITTAVCSHFYANDKNYPGDLAGMVDSALEAVENSVGMRFGDATNPLLVSVRSGAPVSMPGMMDTVLNLGLNDTTVQGLAARSGDARFAYDSYRRFIQMYGDVVLGCDHFLFEEAMEDVKTEKGAREDIELDADDLQNLIVRYKRIVEQEIGTPFPEAPRDQLWGAIGAVFGSWQTSRAITYRRLHEIKDNMGTAVNVQAMVFGNMGDDCATGVAFTRNPSTGERRFYGEFLVNAQGEDVVAGIRTPQPLTTVMKDEGDGDLPAMEEVMPRAYQELVEVFDRLERHYQDMQDIEFTVQSDKLYILQTRNGKRTAAAALRIAVEMAEDGLIDEGKAVLRLDPATLDQLLHPTLDPDAEVTVIAKGLPASPGAVSGKVVFSADAAEAAAKQGEHVILVRIETSPEDIHGMHAAQGILTARGGMTSHAAVVARGMGKACVSGVGAMQIDYRAGRFTVAGVTVEAGDTITLDGAAGTVMQGAVPTRSPELSGDFAKLMVWADRTRRLRVRANAETPEDVQQACEFGAEGIGLCRTEHMFFADERIAAMREMILAEDQAGREAALAKLLPYQRGDFVEIFRIMAGLPVTIRLLDPPLHEFLPHGEEEMAEVAESLGVELKALRKRLADLDEVNPMLGLRGCRLGVLYPEIVAMQARAIIEAALIVQEETGDTVVPEIMVPLVGYADELKLIKTEIDQTAQAVMAEKNAELDYLVGTMIELPRAALRAADIAEHAAFFSFGTNDLTQMTLGISRDDSGRFLQPYRDAGIFEHDPFQSLDVDGVGTLIKLAAEQGRAARNSIKLGICGEHGGDPKSVAFCDAIDLDYVSCSPFRVPIARLAAAQAALCHQTERPAGEARGQPSVATEAPVHASAAR